MNKDKRGVLGLNTIKAFLVVILSVGVIAMVLLITLSSLSTDTIIDNVGETIDGGETVNETLTSLSDDLQNVTIAGLNGVSCTFADVVNSSGGEVIGSGNYTTTVCAIQFTANSSNANYNNTNWDVTYRHEFVNIIGLSNISADTSSGVLTLFSNASTWFSLLAVVVIILIISIVVIAVNRFGTGAVEGSGGAGKDGLL